MHLIVDEVATGFGRTTKMFACEHEDVRPDFMCLAKGITGGYLPLAATLATEEIYAAFLGGHGEMKHFFHGHTYTANPLACAVGLASLDLLARETLANTVPRSLEITDALRRLATHERVVATRQRGMMAGIVVRGDAREVCARARTHGVILRPLGDVVVWMPPLNVSHSELELLEQATMRALDESA